MRVSILRLWHDFCFRQLLTHPRNEIIKRLKLMRLAAADQFCRAAPGVFIRQVAIRPQADNEGGFSNFLLHED